MKLFSQKHEFTAIAGMLAPSKTLQGRLLSELNESHFTTPLAIELYSAITHYISRRGEPPSKLLLTGATSLSSEVRRVAKDLPNPPRNHRELEDLITVLKDHRRARSLYSLFKRGLDNLSGDSLDMDTLRQLIEEGVITINTEGNVQDQIMMIGKDDTSDDTAQDILYGENNDHFIPTGFKTFDDRNGGIPRNGLFIIGGGSGSGKSHMITSLGHNQALAGYRIGVVPLEMSREEMLTRKLSLVGGVDSLRIARKMLTSEEKDLIWDRYQKFKRKLEHSGGQIQVFNPDGDLRIEEATAALEVFRPDIIYIDYIGLLAGADGEDQWRQLGKMARYGKIWAGKNNRVMALAAQVSEDGRLRYSQAMKEHASLAWSFVATKDSRENGYLNIEMIKGRNQIMFDFTLKIKYETSTIRDMDREELDRVLRAAEANSSKKKGVSAPNQFADIT